MENRTDTNSEKLSAIQSMAVVAFVIFVGWGIYQKTQPYKPSDREIVGRPDIVVLGQESMLTVRDYFGVVTIGNSRFIESKGNLMYTKVPTSIGAFKHQRFGLKAYVLVPKKHTDLKWEKDIDVRALPSSNRRLIIDNASNKTIKVSIDSTSMPVLEAHSHAVISLGIGRLYKIEVRTIGSSGKITLQLYPNKYDKGFTGEGIEFYMYNHKGKNSYAFHYVEYLPE